MYFFNSLINWETEKQSHWLMAHFKASPLSNVPWHPKSECQECARIFTTAIITLVLWQWFFRELVMQGAVLSVCNLHPLRRELRKNIKSLEGKFPLRDVANLRANACIKCIVSEPFIGLKINAFSSELMSYDYL